jgi:steroid 5-alpha reductase family enzyme
MYLRNDPRYIHQTCILETVPSRTAASASVEPHIERSDRHSNLVLSLFCLGSLIETASELGRKNFKSKPENKGKLYTGGFFAFARHVNFGGYAMWRIG